MSSRKQLLALVRLVLFGENENQQGTSTAPGSPPQPKLALGLTGYVLIAMRYEERDLARTFGTRYNRWRSVPQ